MCIRDSSSSALFPKAFFVCSGKHSHRIAISRSAHLSTSASMSCLYWFRVFGTLTPSQVTLLMANLLLTPFTVLGQNATSLQQSHDSITEVLTHGSGGGCDSHLPLPSPRKDAIHCCSIG